MSRYYGMSVKITKSQPEQVEAIKAAAEQEWPFTKWHTGKAGLTATGKEFLCCGEGEKEFTQRLSKAIWRANGSYCGVTVNATFLERLELSASRYSETNRLDESDYERLLRAEAVPAST